MQKKTCSTYTFPGPVIVAQVSLVQYSDITSYNRFTWLKKDIAVKEKEKRYFQRNIISLRPCQNRCIASKLFKFVQPSDSQY